MTAAQFAVTSSVREIRITAESLGMDKGMSNVTFGQPYSYVRN